MYNILVTGANGQLGNELKDLSVAYSQYIFYFTDVDELDITNKKELSSYFENKRITHVINCAAYTAVDKAEEDADKAFLLNAEAPKLLAKVANEYDTHLIHISTDFVFD